MFCSHLLCPWVQSFVQTVDWQVPKTQTFPAGQLRLVRHSTQEALRQNGVNPMQAVSLKLYEHCPFEHAPGETNVFLIVSFLQVFAGGVLQTILPQGFVEMHCPLWQPLVQDWVLSV